MEQPIRRIAAPKVAAGLPSKDEPVKPAVGVEFLKTQLNSLPPVPGVYRMVDQDGAVLYVGKARNLRHRVASYTHTGRLSTRIARMVAQTEGLEVVTTHTEVEALLLESNLIKRFMPRYNVLLRDNKSFPYILLTSENSWPRLMQYRGPRSRTGEFFGPFASAGAVKHTLNTLERAFLLRSCSDSVFASRTRPCLKYQLKRCSAPCVGRITRDTYNELVSQARAFLTGRSKEVQETLAADMDTASEALDFESAARSRDRIRAMSQILAHQGINLEGANIEDADVIAVHGTNGCCCVQTFFFRGGRNNGNRAYYLRYDKSFDLPDVLAAFIGQFYYNKMPPQQILLSHRPPQQILISKALSVRAKHNVRLICPQRGVKRTVVEHARINAREALSRHSEERTSQQQLLERTVKIFGLESVPQRIEVYDNSHISGTNAIGVMVVAGTQGFTKAAYRKFTIQGSNATRKQDSFVPGDDYAMMREVLTRRFKGALKEDPERTSGRWPDLVLIDGGKGQLNAALDVFIELGIDDVVVAAVAKGEKRNAGRERIFLQDRQPIQLDPHDPVLHFVQRLRDEAHRYAIGGHLAKRAKQMTRSQLDEIRGIGARRKKALLHRFGSARGVSRAGLNDLVSVDGISRRLAQQIYYYFNTQD